MSALWASWKLHGPSLGCPEPLVAISGPLGALLDRLGSLLGPLWSVLEPPFRRRAQRGKPERAGLLRGRRGFSEALRPSEKPCVSSEKAQKSSQEAGGLLSLLRRPAPSHFPPGPAAESEKSTNKSTKHRTSPRTSGSLWGPPGTFEDLREPPKPGKTPENQPKTSENLRRQIHGKFSKNPLPLRARRRLLPPEE